MRNITFFLIILGSLVLRDSVIAQTKKQSATKITFTTDLPDSLKSVVNETVKLFSSKYGPISYLSIGRDTVTKPVQRSDGGIETTDAYTISGAIFINKNIQWTRVGLRNTIKHELFHAIAPVKSRLLPVDSSYELTTDGFKVVGYHGLALIVRNTEKKIESGFRLIEEAAAEVCALKLENGYLVHSYTYFALGSFMQDMVDAGWITTNQLITCQKSNDFLGFCGKILKKPRAVVTPDDVVYVTDCFQKIYESKKNYKSVMLSIIEKRGEKGQYNIKD